MSVRERKRNQIYQIEISLAYRADGSRKRHYETFYGGKKRSTSKGSKIKNRI